jgi:hypothetical protein
MPSCRQRGMMSSGISLSGPVDAETSLARREMDRMRHISFIFLVF